MNIASRIRLVVESSGLSITDFAEKCQIPYSSLQNYLRGLREPKADALIALSTHMGTSIDWLLTGEGDMHRQQGGTSGADSSLTPRQTALLTLFNELDENAQREIQIAAEEKKRLAELEKRISRLEAYGPDG